MAAAGSRGTEQRENEEGETLPLMTSQQSSLELCLATSSRMKRLSDDLLRGAFLATGGATIAAKELRAKSATVASPARS